MSDSKSSYGDPVEEPKPEGDVVDRAKEGLADAEAASRDAVPAPAHPPVAEGSVPAAAEAAESVDVVSAEAVAWYDRPLEETPGAAEPERAITPSEPETVVVAAETVAVVEPAERASEPAASAPVAPVAPQAVYPVEQGVAPALQPIFVQAPEPPRPRSNRGAAGLIGLLAALCFGIVLLGVDLLLGLVLGAVDGSRVLSWTLEGLTHWSFWIPVIVFFLAFWILGAIINRGAWGHWVVWGLLVGVASYAGFLLGQLFQAPFWQLTAREGAELLQASVLAPLAIVSFVVGRELTIWFGAWVAARGRRVTEINEAAQREYERTLEAGPQLYQQ